MPFEFSLKLVYNIMTHNSCESFFFYVTTPIIISLCSFYDALNLYRIINMFIINENNQ